MPWLVMNKVLFIHVPRCGGTSITKHHRVGFKARQGVNLYYKLGIMYYYYRYRLLEQANFPVFTYENAFALLSITVGIFVYFFVNPVPPFPFVMWSLASCTILTSTFIWTAPVTMRNNTLRWLLMMLQSKVLCGLGSDTRYMVGTNDKAYLFHITAARAIKFNYVTLEQTRRCGFSIVRNPYSRVVSMYEYNKRPCESFASFVRSFHAEYWRVYVGRGSSECVDIYCHILPMVEYTHRAGEQIVACVIKQEHLKRLVATDWADSDVPPAVRDALTGIPHANRRSRKVAWQRYYTQETLELVYEMYHRDFDVFGYALEISGRPDLSVPEALVAACRAEAQGSAQRHMFRAGNATAAGAASAAGTGEPQQQKQQLKGKRQRYARLGEADEAAPRVGAEDGDAADSAKVHVSGGGGDVEMGAVSLQEDSSDSDELARMTLGAEDVEHGATVPRAGQETHESAEEVALRKDAAAFVLSTA